MVTPPHADAIVQPSSKEIGASSSLSAATKLLNLSATQQGEQQSVTTTLPDPVIVEEEKEPPVNTGKSICQKLICLNWY